MRMSKMQSVAGLFGLAILAISLSGCLKTRIDESDVFEPQPVDVQAEDVNAMSLDNEREMTRPTKEELIDARGYAGHLPAQFEHGFIGDGEKRIAWTLVSSITSNLNENKRPLIVHCFGNTSDRRRHGVDVAQKVFPWGDAFLFDYPGYGDSGGEADADSMYDMQILVADYIDKISTDRPLILWGHSLGGFVCSELGRSSREVDMVVLEATAKNIQEVTKEWKPWYLPFVKVDIKASLKDYDNARALNHFDGPVLVLGAEKDEKLPVKLAKSLYKDLRKREVDVTYMEFAKAEHSTIPDQFDFAQRVGPFIEQVKDLD